MPCNLVLEVRGMASHGWTGRWMKVRVDILSCSVGLVCRSVSMQDTRSVWVYPVPLQTWPGQSKQETHHINITSLAGPHSTIVLCSRRQSFIQTQITRLKWSITSAEPVNRSMICITIVLESLHRQNYSHHQPHHYVRKTRQSDINTSTFFYNSSQLTPNQPERVRKLENMRQLNPTKSGLQRR